ncbi:MAG: hypothetical protein CL604_15065 [Alteromonadaceae bacterium]|nr:hypothetical protein [Alteromonadaceae bacterium]|tara:strand:- start:3133 stop:6273 length:3141 start_codon:yes stop_codon:yes gene_type:complete
MLYVLFTVAGAIILGGIAESVSGLVTGGALGWIAASVVRLQQKVSRQNDQIQALTTELASARQADTPIETASAAAPAPETLATREATPAAESPPAASVEAEDVSLELELHPEPVENAWRAAPEPREPAPKSAVEGWLDKVFDKARQWVVSYFTGGNLMVRVGILILFFGVAFLLKYAAEKVVVPLELRYTGILAAALVMLVLGWRLRRKNAAYGLVMQGGATGLIYLAIFAAFQLHQLLTPTTAFSLLLLVVVATAALAVIQNAVWLAAMGVTGGFLAPVLASSGSGDYISLFSYYLVLNLGIALIAFYRSWRFLNWLGFVFTFGIGTVWGAQFYQAAFFNSVEPFLVGFFLLYTLIALLFAMKQPPALKGLVDGTLVFGTPVAFMGLQSQLLDDYTSVPYMMAWSSAAVGAIYLALARFVRHRAGLGLLCESYIALAIAFLTLAIPLAFDGRVTSAVWAAEGAALIWVGLRQGHLLPRLSGLGLMLVAAVFYWDESPASWPTTFVFNADFIGSVLLAGAACYAAHLYHRHRDKLTLPEQKFGARALLVWGYIWWLGGGLRDIDNHFNGLAELLLVEVLVALTGIACWLAVKRYRAIAPFILGLVTAGAGLLLMLLLHRYPLANTLLINFNMLSALIVAGLCLWMAISAHRNRFSDSIAVASVAQRVLLWAATLTLLGFGFGEIDHFVAEGLKGSLSLLLALVVLLPLIALHRRVNWAPLTQPVLLLLPIIGFTLVIYVIRDEPLLAHYGWLIFPAAWAAWYGALRYLEKQPGYPLGALHVASALLLTVSIGWQLSQPLSAGIWAISAWGLTFALALVAIQRLKHLGWPFQRHAATMNTLLPRILVGLLALWMVISNLQAPGSSGAIPYLPLLNPLDLTNLAAIWLIFRWLHRHDPTLITDRQLAYGLPGALAFLWINAALLRAFHFTLDIPFRFEPMLASFAVQSGLSILWSVIGLVTMLLATRRGWRPLWLVGGALMAVVVLKLFTVDMSGTGTIARIIAFLTVGGLLLVVGYFAPVPPRAPEDPEDSDRSTIADNSEALHDKH